MDQALKPLVQRDIFMLYSGKDVHLEKVKLPVQLSHPHTYLPALLLSM